MIYFVQAGVRGPVKIGKTRLISPTSSKQSRRRPAKSSGHVRATPHGRKAGDDAAAR